MREWHGSRKKCVSHNMLRLSLWDLCALTRDESKPECNGASVCSGWRIDLIIVPQNKDLQLRRHKPVQKALSNSYISPGSWQYKSEAMVKQRSNLKFTKCLHLVIQDQPLVFPSLCKINGCPHPFSPLSQAGTPWLTYTFPANNLKVELTIVFVCFIWK